MQCNKIISAFIFLFVLCQCYGRNVTEVLHDEPQIQVTPGGVLDLSGNNIDSLDGLGQVPRINQVRFLNLSHNELVHLDDRAFAMMPTLDRVDLQDNRLVTVGNNLFARPGVYTNVSDNELPEAQLFTLQAQLVPDDQLQGWAGKFRSLDRLQARFVRTEVGQGLMLWGAAAARICAGLGMYIALKMVLSHPQLEKANLIVDTALHGINVVRFFMLLLKRRSLIDGRECVNALSNVVILHNLLRAPNTVNGIIQGYSGINFNPIVSNSLLGWLSLLPCWRWLPGVPNPIQDAMMIPWAVCPSGARKCSEGVDGVITAQGVGLVALGRIKNVVSDRANNYTLKARNQRVQENNYVLARARILGLFF